MKTAGAALIAYLNDPAVAMATLIRFDRADGAAHGVVCDWSDAVAYAGLTYSAADGAQISAITQTAGTEVDTAEITGALGAAVTRAGVLAGDWDGAGVKIWWINPLDVAAGALAIRRGKVGRMRAQGGRWTAEFRSMTAAFGRRVGRDITPYCDAVLADTRCGVNLLSITNGRVTGTVTSVVNARTIVDTARIGAGTDWFTHGVLQFLTGLNTGRRAEVKAYNTTTGELKFRLPMWHPISAGDSYTLDAGCSKDHTTCHTKFGNILRFRGFPLVPGGDFLARGGR